MHALLHTYWIEFGQYLSQQYAVTAYSFEDAVYLLKQKVFSREEMPSVKSFREDIQFKDLDQDHVVPNMGATSERGVWFPLFYF